MNLPFNPAIYVDPSAPTKRFERGYEIDGQEETASDCAHLFIVDDDLTGAALIIEYLRDFDFAVTTLNDGARVTDQVRMLQPDLILLDLAMPDMDGFEILRVLQSDALTREIPVILLTARADLESKVRGFRYGAVDYLIKPVAEPELLVRVTSHLQRHRLQRGLEHRLRLFRHRYGDLEETGKTEDSVAECTRSEAQDLYQARQILRERLNDPPSLNELARLIGTNQPRLSKCFRALFGTTVYGFVREERLRRARELLVHTRKPVKTVAWEVGYRNTSDLSRSFKKRFGVSPSEARFGT
ncbi:MAG: response regulator [Gammaproteobacteria bacterium]